MTREDIIRMAREAGWSDRTIFGHDERLERFTTLVAAHEREACAKVCEDDVRTWSHPGSITRAECAAAIRSRGEVKP